MYLRAGGYAPQRTDSQECRPQKYPDLRNCYMTTRWPRPDYALPNRMVRARLPGRRGQGPIGNVTWIDAACALSFVTFILKPTKLRVTHDVLPGVSSPAPLVVAETQ
jgi:hypothetical protein